MIKWYDIWCATLYVRIVQFSAGQVKEDELAGHVAGMRENMCMRILRGKRKRIKPPRICHHRQQNNNQHAGILFHYF